MQKNKFTVNRIRITKEFNFETGHALHGYDGKCKNIHGHSYKLFVTVIGVPLQDSNHVKYGMVIDFSDLKAIVNKEIVDKFDHATVLNMNSPHKKLGETLQKEGHNIILVDYQPTSEMMIVDFVERIKHSLNDLNIDLFSLKLQETNSSCAEWFAMDNL